MENKLKQLLITSISERLTEEVKNIKTMSISTADDYGYNITYFNKIIKEEFDNVLNKK